MNMTGIKEKILDEIAKTELLIAECQELSKPVSPDVAIGRLSRMDAINNKAVSEAVMRQAQDKMSKLRHVLTKVDRPDFGFCLKCKAPIPVGRIMVKPESMYCVKCAD
jgi:DnaK suppressor protein